MGYLNLRFDEDKEEKEHRGKAMLSVEGIFMFTYVMGSRMRMPT